MGINLDSLRPEPCVEGYSTPGGYSYRAVKPIALEKVMSISRLLQQHGFREKGASLSGIGGVETGGDAAEFILLGCDTVQVRAAAEGAAQEEGRLLLRLFLTAGSTTPVQCGCSYIVSILSK
jgi:dihydroorotate dehydrogenase